MRVIRGALIGVLTAALLSGCSGYHLKRAAQDAELLGDWDAAVIHYIDLVRQDPGNIQYRSALLRAKIQASHAHFELAKRFYEAGHLEEALVQLQEAVQLDPTNQYAQVELNKVREALQAHREARDIATSLDTLKDKTRGALAQPPVLDPRSTEPIDLDFPEPVSVMDIYRALGKAFGINVLFDPKLRDQEIAIELKQVVAQDALEILMRASGHFYKVVDEHSIIVAADTPQNRRAYEDLMIQTFFLSNSDVRDVMTMLRSLIDSRKIAANERLNAIILRDTADKVKVAEKLIRINDKARAEVVIDVELMQINSNKLREIGLSLDPGNTIGFTLDGEQVEGGPGPEGGGGGTTIRFSDLEFLDASSWLVTIPSFLVDFVKENTDAQILAKPQLRISEGEQATLVIADRVPIPVTSFNTGNTIGGNIVPITSFQYQDVGITIDIEPRVHHNNEVSLIVAVEISNIAGNIGAQPIIGTRNINTSIRLKDGETNFLAGLIRVDEIRTDTGIPGLSEIPIIGRLFSKRGTQTQRTDIVLTLTPHIIRRADITAEDLLPIWVGTETNFSFGGGSPRVESESEGPFEEDDGEAAEAQDRLRERLRQLPRGLREQGPAGEGDAEDLDEPSTLELAPASAPQRRGRPSLSGAEDRSSLDSPDLPAPIEVMDPADDGVMYAAVEAAPVGGGLELSLRALRPAVSRGEVFEVVLDVVAETPVSHLPLRLTYDEQAIELIDIEERDFLGGGQESQLLFDTSRPGVIVVGASRLGRSHGVAGRGELLALQFRALQSGVAEVGFEKKQALNSLLEQVGPLRTSAAKVVVEEGDVDSGREPLELAPVLEP